MNVRKRRQQSPGVDKDDDAKRMRVGRGVEESPCVKGDGADNDKPSSDTKQRLFAGTTVYVNGSPMPLISDHKLKHLLVSHGANLSLSLARNSVTHVIVGRPSSSTAVGKGAGGGLAARKLNKEIERRGRQVKVVYAEWYEFLSFDLYLYIPSKLIDAGCWKVSKLRNGCPKPVLHWI